MQSLWRTVWSCLKKLKVELPYYSEIPLLGVYLEKKINQKDPSTPMFTAALFTRAISIYKTWKQCKCPSTDEWIKMWYMYTMEYYPATKKNEIIPFATTWMDLEIYQVKWNKKRKTYTIWHHLYVESKVKVKVTQLCPTICEPMDYTVHGILQARILEYSIVAYCFSRGSSQPRNKTKVSSIAGGFFTNWAMRETLWNLKYDTNESIHRTEMT